ncbi:MAG: hypothetical protein CM15mP89_3830 [Gammaproteobacteria bacterium]|nr:MAG: hypothetical protein CM15mP89_3830 [Gammaproteobacteria bacterium]
MMDGRIGRLTPEGEGNQSYPFLAEILTYTAFPRAVGPRNKGGAKETTKWPPA